MVRGKGRGTMAPRLASPLFGSFGGFEVRGKWIGAAIDWQVRGERGSADVV